MRTVRRLFYADIVSAVAFVALAFLALFFFIDFVDELGSIGQRGYTALHAVGLLAAARARPSLRAAAADGADRRHLRAGAAGADLAVHDPAHRRPRPGPGARACWPALALVFGAITFVVGDYLAPISENFASQLRAAFRGSLKLERSGAWIKEHADTPAGERSYSINVGSAERRLDAAPGAHLRVRRRRPAALAHQRGRGQGAPRRPLDALGRRAHALARRRRRLDRPAGAARHARLEEHALAQGRRRRGAAGDDDVDGRALALHRPPRRERADGAAAEDPVLEARPLPVRLPGDGRPGPALRLPQRPLRRRQPEGLHRHHAGRELRAGEQRLSPPRPARQLDAVDRRRRARARST